MKFAWFTNAWLNVTQSFNLLFMIYQLFGFDGILVDLIYVLDLRVHLSNSCEMNLIKIIYLK